VMVSVDRDFQQKCIKMLLEHVKLPKYVREVYCEFHLYWTTVKMNL